GWARAARTSPTPCAGWWPRRRRAPAGFLDDDPYQDWAAPLAEEVRATHVALLRALVSRLRLAGEVDQVVRYTLRLLHNDRFDERAHLDLIEVLQAARRYGEARRRYRIYGRAMTELGIK